MSGEGPLDPRAVVRAHPDPRRQQTEWADATLDMYADAPRGPGPGPAASSACYRTFLTRELPASLLRGPCTLTVPALLAMGDRSPIQRILRPKPAPNLRVETIRSARHFLPEEQPAAVLKLAREWFGETR